MVSAKEVLIKKLKSETADRNELFLILHSYRTSEKVLGITRYWSSQEHKGDKLFSSEGHFIRSSQIFFDRVLRSIESEKYNSLNDFLEKFKEFIENKK